MKNYDPERCRTCYVDECKDCDKFICCSCVKRMTCSDYGDRGAGCSEQWWKGIHVLC